jgi:hypothetical protein
MAVGLLALAGKTALTLGKNYLANQGKKQLGIMAQNYMQNLSSGNTGVSFNPSSGGVSSGPNAINQGNNMLQIGSYGQGAISGLAGGIALAKGLTMNIDPRQDYQANERIMGMADDANQRAQGRMAQSGAVERQMASSAANTQAQLQRASTDASMAFLGASNVGAQRQQSGLQLAQMEAADASRRQQMSTQANMMAANEEMKEFEDQRMKRQEQIATKSQLVSGGLQGLTQGFGAIAQGGYMQLAGLNNPTIGSQTTV